MEEVKLFSCEGVVTGSFSVLQGMTPYPFTYEEHLLDLIGYRNFKKDT